MKRTSQVERIPYDGAAAGHERRSLGEFPSDSKTSPIVSGSRWLMLAFAFVATVINYLDRQTLSVMAPVLLERFKISATSYSPHHFCFHVGLYSDERGVGPTT